ncbi:MAG TPA: hypothetical protein DCP63_06910 [Bacteroidetes bacterium]|nr:hypothetical protein [Bacteroidota bacterium]
MGFSSIWLAKKIALLVIRCNPIVGLHLSAGVLTFTTDTMTQRHVSVLFLVFFHIYAVCGSQLGHTHTSLRESDAPGHIQGHDCGENEVHNNLILNHLCYACVRTTHASAHLTSAFLPLDVPIVLFQFPPDLSASVIPFFSSCPKRGPPAAR